MERSTWYCQCDFHSWIRWNVGHATSPKSQYSMVTNKWCHLVNAQEVTSAVMMVKPKESNPRHALQGFMNPFCDFVNRKENLYSLRKKG